MTRQRADEIIRAVIYRYINYLPEVKSSNEAFHLGRIFGLMQRQLEIELEKEIETQTERKEET